MVSLKNKLLAFKKECFKELFNKETELKNIEKDINYTIEQARKEIFSESQRIDSRINMLKIEEKRILNLRSKVEQEIDVKKQWLESRISKHIDDVIGYFQELLNYGKQQKIIDAYINACYALDEKLSKYFENKQRPAINTAEIVRAYKKENSEYLHRIKELEYQISELWAKDVDGVVKESFEFSDDEEERVRYFLSPREYKSLSPSERNQRALDNYLRRRHSKAHVGKMYERYIGYLYEQDNYEVEYRGINMGLKDGGIDLVCRKDGKVLLVQCKNWNLDSTIYEKHICQLYGAAMYYNENLNQIEFPGTLFANTDYKFVTPVFISTTKLDEHAIAVANCLKVKIYNIPFDNTYPIIKCNINNGNRIYHLPIDQMYDYTKVCNPGECYVRTVKEAEEKGFTRAHRWCGDR